MNLISYGSFYTIYHLYNILLIIFNGDSMKIISIFNENSISLQTIIEQYLIEYCLNIYPFNNK